MSIAEDAPLEKIRALLSGWPTMPAGSERTVLLEIVTVLQQAGYGFDQPEQGSATSEEVLGQGGSGEGRSG